VPRLVARLGVGEARLPVGPEVWTDTTLELPDVVARRSFRDLLTGARIPGSGSTSIMLGQVLSVCPVALLWAEPS
jgi:maltooligosyltrehalose synthase